MQLYFTVLCTYLNLKLKQRGYHLETYINSHRKRSIASFSQGRNPNPLSWSSVLFLAIFLITPLKVTLLQPKNVVTRPCFECHFGLICLDEIVFPPALPSCLPVPLVRSSSRDSFSELSKEKSTELSSFCAFQTLVAHTIH